jgi:hypothetical protein
MSPYRVHMVRERFLDSERFARAAARASAVLRGASTTHVEFKL